MPNLTVNSISRVNVYKPIMRKAMKHESPLKNLNSGGGTLNHSNGPDIIMLVPDGVSFKEKAYYYLTGGKIPKSLSERWQSIDKEGLEVHPNDELLNFSQLSYGNVDDAVVSGSEFLGLSTEHEGENLVSRIMDFFTGGDSVL